jgi:hypothetical protein
MENCIIGQALGNSHGENNNKGGKNKKGCQKARENKTAYNRIGFEIAGGDEFDLLLRG